jgi:hypothetical protein
MSQIVVGAVSTHLAALACCRFDLFVAVAIDAIRDIFRFRMWFGVLAKVTGKAREAGESIKPGAPAPGS